MFKETPLAGESIFHLSFLTAERENCIRKILLSPLHLLFFIIYILEQEDFFFLFALRCYHNINYSVEREYEI